MIMGRLSDHTSERFIYEDGRLYAEYYGLSW